MNNVETNPNIVFYCVLIQPLSTHDTFGQASVYLLFKDSINWIGWLAVLTTRTMTTSQSMNLLYANASKWFWEKKIICNGSFLRNWRAILIPAVWRETAKTTHGTKERKKKKARRESKRARETEFTHSCKQLSHSRCHRNLFRLFFFVSFLSALLPFRRLHSIESKIQFRW